MKRYTIAYAHRGQAIAETREKIGLLYKGNGQLMDTVIILDNNRVVDKQKYR